MAKQVHKEKVKGAWLFLGAMLLAYGVTALINFSVARQSLHMFGNVFMQLLPVLVFVFVLLVLVNLTLTPDRIRKYVGKTSGLKGWLLALVGGVFSSGPVYTWYILLAELKQQGMKASLIAVFLYSRAVKLPLLPLLVHYFGLQYTIILSLYLLCFSILSGIITGALLGENKSSE